MTDEEIDRMADNFVNAQDFTRVYSVARKAECGAFWKYGYLAGLKAGRPEWHKVADGDLPKEEDLEMQVLCFTHDGYQLLSLFSDPKPIFKGYGVIAWCEIPKYTEE